MPMITVVIILIILQGNPVAPHPPRPTQDSLGHSARLDSPSHVGGGSGANPSPWLAGGALLLPSEHRPPPQPPTPPLSNGFPSPSWLRGPSSGRKSPQFQWKFLSCWSHRLLGPLLTPTPSAPSPPSARSGARLPRKDLTGNFLQLSYWGSSVNQLPAPPSPPSPPSPPHLLQSPLPKPQSL